MRAGSPRTRGNAGWRRADIDLARAGVVLREAGFAVSDGDPVVAYGHFDRQNRPRRIHALYSDGWRVTLVLRTNGAHSLSFTFKMVTGPRAPIA